ncbi:MAG: hypothetical protein ACE5DI_00795 [Candidatus Micrarchaeia archaeon]
MQRSHGSQSKQSRNLKSKGRRAITVQLRKFDDGARVRIDVDPRFAGGRPPLKYNHLNAKVLKQRGKWSYEVVISDSGRRKMVCVSNVHLVPQ